MPVMSIEPEEARKKLQVVAVFVLVNQRGDFYQISSGSSDTIPLYLREADAQAQLQKLVDNTKDLDARVQAYSLNLFYDKAERLFELSRLKNKDLLVPIVGSAFDRSKAVEILREEGLSDGQIEKQLRVPVFFSDPMMVAAAKGGNREVFFMSYDQLLERINGLPKSARQNVKKRVANLDVVMRLIEETEDDRYVFMETPDYARLRKAYLKDLRE